jgi:hypothetical protein
MRTASSFDEVSPVGGQCCCPFDTSLIPWWHSIGCGSRSVSSLNWLSLSNWFFTATHRAISDHSCGWLTHRVDRPWDRRHRIISMFRQYAVQLLVQGHFRCLGPLSGTVYRRTSLLSTVYLSRRRLNFCLFRHSYPGVCKYILNLYRGQEAFKYCSLSRYFIGN